MFHKKRSIAVIIFMYLFIFLGGQALADPSKIYRTKLDNGLTVIIEEEHSAPVASVQMWVKVGSADEPERLAGISHVFEHMLFKGTDKRKVGQIANMVESVGGDINAYTSYDNTVFHLTVPSRHFATGLDVISDAIQHSSFDPTELKKELEVVLEELRMNEDNPGRRLYKSLMGDAYIAHPYKRPVIGYVNTVKSLTRPEIVGFFKRWYIPNNMVLVIVGDVDHEQALKAVKGFFKDFKPAPDPHKKRPVEPVQNEVRPDAFAMQVQDSQLGMCFHIPDVKNEDVFAIDVLEEVLSGGETSRLYKKLKIEDELVHSISAYSMTLKNPGLFFITAVLKPENIDKTISETLAVIERLEREGPNHEELERAKFGLESSFIFSRESMDGLAGKLGYFEVSLDDVNYEKKYIEGIRKVSPEDVKRVVRKYLRPEGATITALMPLDKKDLVSKDALVSLVKTSAAQARAELKEAKKEEGRTTRFKLDNGIDLIVKEVHSNPTVAFYAAFPGGLRFEEKAKNGVGSFTAGMLTRGTAKRTREDLARELEDISGGVSGFSGWNSTGISGKFLSQFFDKGLGIMADVMLNPTFPQDEITKLKADATAAIKRQEDSLYSYTFKLLYSKLFKEHPYGMQISGTVESVNSLTRDDLIAHHKQFFSPERMVFTIVGDVDTDYALKKVKDLFGGFKAQAGQLPPVVKEVPEAAIETTGAVKKKEQTHIGIGFNGTTIGSDDSYALRVMTEILSGQGGRLFIDLRDVKSLAYTVSAFSREGMDPGVVGAYIASAPDKKDEAIKGLIDEFRRIREGKVTDEELNRAKKSLIGGYEIGLQEVGSQATDMSNNELYGLGYDFYKKYPDKIQAVTAEDVQRVARKYLNLDAYVISIVGPNGPAEAK